MAILEFLANFRTPLLDKFFLLITELGGEMAFIAVAVIVYWCISKKNGFLLLSIGFVGMVVNQFLKLSFQTLRPWDVNTSFKPVEAAVPDALGFSFPSGHSQNSVGVYGSIALFTKNQWVRAISLVLCLLIPFSRVYLGVHYPVDVLFSFFFAILVIIFVTPIFNNAYRTLRGMYLFLGAMLFISILYLLYVEVFFDSSSLTTGQEHNYVSALESAYLILGAIIGVMIALPIERRIIKFKTSGRWYTQIIKCIIGIPLVLLLLEGLKLPLNAIFDESTFARALRYGIVVIFIVAVYPITFKLISRLEKKIEGKKQKAKQ